MSGWFKNPLILIISFTLAAASCNNLLGSLVHSMNTPITGVHSDILDQDVETSGFSNQNTYSYVVNQISSLATMTKSGLRSFQKLPWKTLALFLALQSSNIPTVKAITATNLNQTLSYVVDGPAVLLLPMSVDSPSARINFDILFTSGLAEGVISSTASLPLAMFAPNTWWRANGNKTELDRLTSNLLFTPKRGLNQVISLATGYSETSPPFQDVSGHITLNPVNSLPSTTPPATSSPTTKTSTSLQSGTTIIQISNSIPTTIESRVPHSGSTDLLTTSSKMSPIETVPAGTLTTEQVLPTQFTVSKSTIDSELDPSKTFPLMPDESSSHNPPYAIIGGVVGGLVVCAGAVAGVVLYKQNQKRKRSKSSAVKMNTLPIAPMIADAGKTQRSLDIDKPVVQYDVVPEGALLNAQYEIIPQKPSPALNQYDGIHAPLNQYEPMDAPFGV